MVEDEIRVIARDEIEKAAAAVAAAATARRIRELHSEQIQGDSQQAEEKAEQQFIPFVIIFKTVINDNFYYRYQYHATQEVIESIANDWRKAAMGSYPVFKSGNGPVLRPCTLMLRFDDVLFIG